MTTRAISRRASVLAVIALAATAGGVAYATIPASTGTINGCYEKRTGILRVIDTDAGAKCTSYETPISWNQKGQKGATGPAGAQGLKGDAGSPGDRGPTGAAGVQGEKGATGPQGAMGGTGPAGQQGPTGADGLRGALGPTGPQGAKGDPGPTYAAGNGLALFGNVFSIPNGAIGGGLFGLVRDESLTGDDIAPNAVGASELAPNAVVGGPAGDLTDESLTGEDLAPNAVGASELAPSAVLGGFGGDLSDNSITSDDLAVGAVGSSEVANGSLRKEDLGVFSASFGSDPPSIPAQSCSDEAHPVFGNVLASSDFVLAQAPASLSDGLVMHALAPSMSGTTPVVKLRFCNVTAAAINQPAISVDVLVLR